MAQTLEGLRSGAYRGTKRLKISSGDLTTFPREIFKLSRSLEFLDLSGNPQLSELPSDFGRLHNLKIAFFSDCSFTIFPKQLADCRNLEMVAFKGNGMTTIPEDSLPLNIRWLILTNNKIESLPRSIGKCTRLQKCMLAGNNLTELPDEMANCKKLGLLRLSANRIERLPVWLFEELPELSFLAFAGNPCLRREELIDNPVLQEIAWADLEVKEVLGEGASGTISRGIWKVAEEDEKHEKHVAVKIFKGDVTSDGLPLDEMAACIVAGTHPHLISTIGKVHGHDEAKRGIVLELIPPHFENLGQPPSLQSCTRDTFPQGKYFSVGKIKRILVSIASAAAHLHEKGVAHGDLYAHNILLDEAGHSLLGDFGAATVYDENHEHAEAIEKLEVYAFGHLIEDMLGLLDAEVFGEKEAIVEEALSELHYRCMSPVVKERPSFKEIMEELKGI
jgi:hypothetical protein